MKFDLEPANKFIDVFGYYKGFGVLVQMNDINIELIARFGGVTTRWDKFEPIVLEIRRLVEAGFGRRVMYGSDQMFWPDAIPLSIEWVESADFLSEEQKRDIFYNNAKRFLRL